MMDQYKNPISYEAYQNMAELYATSVKMKPFNAYYERPGSLSLMPEVNGMKVLDAGCSAGFYANWFTEHGAKVIGLDFSENMISYSQELLKGKAEFYLADLNQPLTMIDDHSMDLINSSLTIHYLIDLDFTFSEFARVLKPNGYFIFSVHHPAETTKWHKIENYHKPIIVSDVWKGMINTKVSYYHRSLSAYTEALHKNGFIIEQIIEPQPEKIVEELNKDIYQRLSTQPTFLFFKARHHTIKG